MTGVGFHPEARAELLASVRYYDEQADGLGRQFTNEVERAVRLVAEQPGLGAPIADTDLRQWALRRFPYYLIYRAEQSTLLILAVAHHRRRPGYWEERS